MGKNQKVFIICGVHNDLSSTKKFLTSLSRQSYPFIQTIIIDDGSSDGSSNYIKKKYPQVKILQGDGNLWWTGSIYWGVKESLKYAKVEDFILTINNDCTFDKNFVDMLVRTSIEHNRAIVGSLILGNKSTSKIYDAGIQIDWSKGRLIPLGPTSINDLPNDKNVQDQIDTISTKGTIYPIEVFHKIGNFDKKHLPHYISDYEFACRAKAHGFKLILSYKARIYNDVQRTGFGDFNSNQFIIKKLNNLFFSRKSKINIIDHFWFITLCCPRQYKLQNYLLLIGKVLYLILTKLGIS